MKKIFFLTLMAIFLPLILFAFVGCMKKPENKADYGPEVPMNEIRKAVDAVAPPDLYSMRKGQFVSIDESQVIDTQLPLTYYQRLDKVVGYDVVGDITTLTFDITTNELVDGKWVPFSLSNIPVSYKNTSILFQSTDVKSLATRTKKSSGLSLMSLKKQDEEVKKKVTYHNLTQETGVMPVPPAVSKQTDCGGLSELACKNGLRYIQVKFDRVIWDTEDHGTKTAMTFIYSADAPTYVYSWDDMNALEITNQIKTCAQTWVELDAGGGNKQTVPVLQCAEVRDFHFGQVSP